MAVRLPPRCERPLFERFLRAEAMALLSVRSAKRHGMPLNVSRFLERHEADEERHLQTFEQLLGVPSFRKTTLPGVPSQWPALAVHLFGYETLGLEFAKLLVALRPDLFEILNDEERHVGFFEKEVAKVLAGSEAEQLVARTFAKAWWRRLPKTVHRYLQDDALADFRNDIQKEILVSIERRFATLGLLS